MNPLKGANLSTVSYQNSLDLLNVLSADVPFCFLAYYDVNGKVCFKNFPLFLFLLTFILSLIW